MFFNRRPEIDNAVITADRYSEIRGFFGRIDGLEQTPVVLVRRWGRISNRYENETARACCSVYVGNLDEGLQLEWVRLLIV